MKKIIDLLKRIWCEIMGHNWIAYGWTGNINWPTIGKKCKVCKIGKEWE